MTNKDLWPIVHIPKITYLGGHLNFNKRISACELFMCLATRLSPQKTKLSVKQKSIMSRMRVAHHNNTIMVYSGYIKNVYLAIF